MTEGEKLLFECGFTLFKERHDEHANFLDYRNNNEYISFSQCSDDTYNAIAWEDIGDELFIPLICGNNLIEAINVRLQELNAEVEDVRN